MNGINTYFLCILIDYIQRYGGCCVTYTIYITYINIIII